MQADAEQRSGLGELIKLRDRFLEENLKIQAIKDEMRKDELRQLKGDVYISDLPKEPEPALRADRRIRSLKDMANALGRQQETYDPSLDQPQLNSRGTRLGNYLYNAIPSRASEKVADFLDDAYGFLKDPYQVSGAQFAEDGYTAADEGIEEGDPLKAAGGLGMMAMTALPFSGKVGQAAFNGPLRAAVSGGAISASPLLAQEAFSADEAMAADDKVMLLLKQQGEINRQRSDLKKSMDKEARTGKGPNWEALKSEYDDLGSTLSAIQSQIEHERSANSFETQLKNKDLERKQEANTPFREKYPWAVPAVQVGAGALAGLLGFGSQWNKNTKFNKATGDISRRWGKSVKDANDPTDLLRAERAADEAQNFGKVMDDATQTKLSDYLIPSVAGTAAFTAGDAAAMLPIVADKLQSEPGSPLYEKASEEMSLQNWPEIMGRMAAGGLFNLIPYKAGKATADWARPKNTPKRYDAETEALKPLSRKGAGKYYKGKASDDLLNAEDFYASRRERHSLTDARLKSEREHLSTPEGRQSLRKAGHLDPSPQEQQTRRQQRQDESSSPPQETSEYLKAREAYHNYKKIKNAKPERAQQLLTKLRSEQAKAQSKKGGRWDGGYSE